MITTTPTPRQTDRPLLWRGFPSPCNSAPIVLGEEWGGEFFRRNWKMSRGKIELKKMANSFENLNQELLAIGYESTTVEPLMTFLNERWGEKADTLEKFMPIWTHRAKELYGSSAPRGMANFDLLKHFFHGVFAQESATYTYGDMKFESQFISMDVAQVYGATTKLAIHKLASGETIVIPESFVDGIETLLKQQSQYNTEVNGEIVLHGVQDTDGERVILFDGIEPYMIIASKLDVIKQPDHSDNLRHLTQVISAHANIKEEKWKDYLLEEENIFSKSVPKSVYERWSHEAGQDSVCQFLQIQSFGYFRRSMVDSIREEDCLASWLNPDFLQKLRRDAQTRGFSDIYELLELDQTYLQKVSVGTPDGICHVTQNTGAINRTRIHSHPEAVAAEISEDVPASVKDNRRPSEEIGRLEDTKQFKMRLIDDDKTIDVNFEGIACEKNGVPSLTIFSIDPQKGYHVSILNLIKNQ